MASEAASRRTGFQRENKHADVQGNNASAFRVTGSQIDDERANASSAAFGDVQGMHSVREADSIYSQGVQGMARQPRWQTCVTGLMEPAQRMTAEHLPEARNTPAPKGNIRHVKRRLTESDTATHGSLARKMAPFSAIATLDDSGIPAENPSCPTPSSPCLPPRWMHAPT